MIEFPIWSRRRTRRSRFDSATFFRVFQALLLFPSTNTSMESLEPHVSEKSLHGRFIKEVLAGQSKTFLDLTSGALEGVAPEESGVTRSSGRRDRYAIGTVARVDLNDQRYLLAALSRTDLLSLKASATIHDLWTCLAGVWKGIRKYSNGQPVRIPLIGSGLSGLGCHQGTWLRLWDVVSCHRRSGRWQTG